MSQYLCIRKNNENLCSFSRSSNVYKFFELPYTESWKELTNEDIKAAFEEAQNDRIKYTSRINDREKLLTGLKYEDALQCLEDIKSLREELEDVISAMYYINLLSIIANEYCEDDTKHKMYYCIS